MAHRLQYKISSDGDEGAVLQGGIVSFRFDILITHSAD